MQQQFRMHTGHHHRWISSSPGCCTAIPTTHKILRFRRQSPPRAASNEATSETAATDSTTETKLERLRTWLKSLNYEDCNLKVERCPFGTSGSGYGAVAGPGGVVKGSDIVRVPRKALMTEDTAAQCPDVGPLVKRSNLTPWQVMCLHLLNERSRGKASFWYPYIAVLPTELELVGAHPMFWSQRMRSEWLEGSPMLEVIQNRLAICREDEEALRMAGAERLARGGHVFVSDAAVRWAATILLSRSFSLNFEDEKFVAGSFTEEEISLVPWADMLNHSSMAGKESCLVYNPRSGIASLKAHCTYAEGEPVYDSYGPSLSPSRLLLDYGFVDEENSNHSVDLSASILGPAKSKANELLLQTVGLPVDGAVFSLTPTGVDESVVAWTRAAVASCQELTDAGWKEGAHMKSDGYGYAAKAMFQFSKPVSQENETEVLRRLLWACEDLSKRYPTTYEQDAKMLSEAESKSAKALPWGRRQALQALMSEKKALRDARQRIWEALKNLQSGVSLTSPYQ